MMLSEMLNVLMDGLKDANMLLDYAKEACANGDGQSCSWFKSHAKIRIDELDSIYDHVVDVAHIEDKVRQGDEIAVVLHQYINAQLDEIGRRYNTI